GVRRRALCVAMTLSHGLLLCGRSRSASRTLSARSMKRSESEQQQQRDQQREDAERFGHGEAENQVAELALGCGGIADCRGEIVAEDDAHACACATHANAGNTSANVLRGNRIHVTNSFLRFGETGLVQWPGWIASLR